MSYLRDLCSDKMVFNIMSWNLPDGIHVKYYTINNKDPDFFDAHTSLNSAVCISSQHLAGLGGSVGCAV